MLIYIFTHKVFIFYLEWRIRCGITPDEIKISITESPSLERWDKVQVASVKISASVCFIKIAQSTGIAFFNSGCDLPPIKFDIAHVPCFIKSRLLELWTIWRSGSRAPHFNTMSLNIGESPEIFPRAQID